MDRNLADWLNTPVKTGKHVFVAPGATVIGAVELGDESSVWYGCVLRADGDVIKIGDRSNIQDNAVVHVDPGAPVTIGDDCIIGHCAIVHGATLGNRVLVGMHATVLNGAVVGDDCIIGANALVTQNMQIPAGSMVLGSPAKVVRPLKEQELAAIRKNAEVYVEKAHAFLKYYSSRE